MRSGTTSLHHILNRHDRIFIPPREVFFFDIDDIEQHPDFFVHTSHAWSFHDYERRFDEYLSWYTSFFKDAREDQIVGEDSTTYMASPKAPSRIARLLPDVKLFFMLRDPVRRTYSHYWYLVHTGRAVYDFERTLQYMPGTLLQRSLYKSHIQRYKECFPDRSMRFIIFEEFVKDVQAATDDACGFLGLRSSVDLRGVHTHKNPARYPRSRRLRIAFNRAFRGLAARRYLHRIPNMPAGRPRPILEMIERRFTRLNSATRASPPPMKQETRRFLERFFATENRGLGELIGTNIREHWPYMDE
jgi:hypothetical protein